VARHLADENSFAWLAERSVDLHLVAVGEKLVEARTSDDPDIRDRCHVRQATFSPEELAEDPPDELADAFSPPVAGEEDDESFAEVSVADPASAEDDEPGVAVFAADDPFLLSVR